MQEDRIFSIGHGSKLNEVESLESSNPENYTFSKRYSVFVFKLIAVHEENERHYIER